MLHRRLMTQGEKIVSLNYIFQEDNVLIHVSKDKKKRFEDNKIAKLYWPANNPDPWRTFRTLKCTNFTEKIKWSNGPV